MSESGGKEEKKNCDHENESHSKNAPETEKRRSERKPIRMPHNEKEEKIARGDVCRRSDYPTMADVDSDWGTENDDSEHEDGGSGQNEGKK
uniref:Uncharacterized protein n=1 Tax=Parascaris univalens TaxID=6257 RepID=A0A914ZLL2_PARUN